MYRRIIKRMLDVLLGLILLPLLLLAVIAFGAAIRLEDHGPVIYVSKRVGKNCRSFSMYKLRSMHLNARDIYNADGSTFNSPDDLRLTRVGRFIRRTSIDELPQIINVLKGDMSFIGPRPVLETQLASFTDDELEKMAVLPGITGYSQAYHRNRLDSRTERLEDARYARDVGFLLDVKILFRTVLTLIRMDDVYRNRSGNCGGRQSK